MNSLLHFAESTARWSYDHARRVLVGWLLLLALGVGAYVVVGANVLDSSESFVGEAGAAEVLEGSHDFIGSRTETVLVSGDSAQLDTATSELVDRLKSEDGVAQVSAPMTGESGDTRAVQVQLPPSTDASAGERVAGMNAAMAAVEQAHPGVDVAATGPLSVRADVTQKYSDRFALLERASIPVTAILLYLVFGGIVAAGVPLVTGMCVVLVGIAGGGLTSFLVPSDSNQLSLILLMGLALGVDYSLFFVRRLREEYAAHPDASTAARVAVSTTSRSVCVAGITIGISVLPLFVTQSPTFHSLALGMIVVIAVVMTLYALIQRRAGRWLASS